MPKTVTLETRQRQSRAQLSLKQQRFVKEYAHLGNGTEAAKRAGYSASSRGNLAFTASDNLRKPHVVSALKQEIAKHEAEYTPQRVRRRLDTISHNAEAAGQFGPAVRCEELLGKAAGMWVDQTLQLTGALSDSHITALLELARRRQAEPIDLLDDQKTKTSDRE